MRALAMALCFATALAFGQKANTDSKEDWQRMKDCAAQAEKIGPSEAEPNKGSYSNHYNPKLGRCFVKITWLTRQGSEISGLGVRLVDAFEHDTVALFQVTFPESESKSPCSIGTTQAGCASVKDFIADRMGQ
jgi:hypothetical protein